MAEWIRGDRGERETTLGAHVSVIGSYYPLLWGLDSRFGSVEGSASLGVGSASHGESGLLFRLGGEKLWGQYPFAEAASLGGGNTEAGLRGQRYAGDASLYGSGELNLGLFRNRRVIPGEFGILALAETGRVFVSGEHSSLWHSAAGPGVWFSPLATRTRISLSYLQGKRRPGFSLRGVLGF